VTKGDRIDSHKIAALIRGGTFPMTYVYPAEMRATRDRLRRRKYLARKRADLLGHIQNTNSQCNLEPFGKKITYKSNRGEVTERFVDPDVRMSMTVDLEPITSARNDRTIRFDFALTCEPLDNDLGFTCKRVRRCRFGARGA
jgi:hypothetical protein